MSEFQKESKGHHAGVKFGLHDQIIGDMESNGGLEKILIQV